jgi:HD-like signal output (HDOD) protein/ActR/RegA family two-component response regulator
MRKSRLLFVDDELPLLDGLRDVLRKERNRWEMVFLSSGEQALAQLASAPFDILISDMRMPGMDGAELLARVKVEYPGAARIILTGHADREAILRALPVAHQFLSKPCETAVLRNTLERTLDLRRYLSLGPVIDRVGRIDALPSIPRTYGELTRAAGDPRSGLAELANIVEQDSAMSVKILQWVNSAYFGVPQRAGSIRQAVNYLGIELLKSLSLSTHAFSPMAVAPQLRGTVEALQERATKVAILARQFLGGEGNQADQAFSAGLLQDVGKLICVAGESSEADLGEVSHAQMGAYLLGVWGLPTVIVEAVAYHLQPSLIGDGPCDVLAAAHAAGALVDAQTESAGFEPCRLDLDFLERSGHRGNVEQWRAIASEVLSPRDNSDGGHSRDSKAAHSLCRR